MKIKLKTFIKPALLAVAFLSLFGIGLAAAKWHKNFSFLVQRNTSSLRDRASETGHYVEHRGDQGAAQYKDAKEVAQHSDAIVVGTVQSNVVRMSSDEKDIFIGYTVNVEDVVKGKIRAGDMIAVNVPGGKVHFPNNTTAEVQTGWFKKMLNGKKYFLFLDKLADKAGYSTTGGAQGVFEIPDDGSGLKTASGRLHDPVWQYQGMRVQDFMALARQALK